MTAYQGNIRPIGLNYSVQQALGEHLLFSYPREACGILLGTAAAGGMHIENYIPMRNVAPDPLHAFIPHPEEWIRALYLEPAPVGLFHSHPNSAPIPSYADLTGLQALGPEFSVYLIGSPSNDPAQPIMNGYNIVRHRNSGGKLTFHLQQAELYALLK